MVNEGSLSAILQPWAVEEQRAYLHALSAREAFHVAEDEETGVVGYQSLDLYSTILPSMAHVAQLGTFLLPSARRSGIGRALFQATRAFADEHGYRKIVIQVRASNVGAQAYYRSLGFTECGRLHRQVRIGGADDDEILLEYFL